MTGNVVQFKPKNGDPNVLYVMIHMVLDAVQHYAYVERDEHAYTVLLDAARSAIEEGSLWCEVPAHLARQIEDIDYAELDSQLIDEAEDSRKRSGN